MQESLEKITKQQETLKNTMTPILKQQEILKNIMTPLLEQQEQMKRIVDDTTRVNIPDLSFLANVTQNYSSLFENPAMKVVSENKNAINVLTPLMEHPVQVFTNSIADKINDSISLAFKTLSENTTKLLAESIRDMVSNISSTLLEAVQSPALKWIQSFDFSPMGTLLEKLNLDNSLLKNYRELNEIYLMTMYECKWFPYAGWTVSVSLLSEVTDIVATSRGKSKNRERRINKAIFGYYTPNEIKNIKRSWKNSELEPHIKKILGQAIEAHLRGEYALTITCLATMWEGLIHRKLHINGRCKQSKTKEEFAKLIEENEFEKVFADFYNNLIVSQCDTPDDVIEGVPNRNGISHSKYKKYPNKKASLNAILLTDFIIALKPKLEMEEK